MIRFERVSKRYPNGREALRDVTLQIGAGEFVFLTGRSGAGKSSILKLVSLLERPTRGTVMVNGQDTGSLPARAIPAFRRRLGVVFQDHQLLMDRPVYDNVALPLIVSDTPFRDIDKRVRAALDQVGLLQYERALPLELSIGEQQRVGIARAVVARPTILVADEHTGNLDHALARDVMQLFERF
jgi:cell division transport system ATP-binding protein